MKRKKRIVGITSIQIGEDLYICPCCDKTVSANDSELHHVKWFCDGGHGLKTNILMICASCHALCTFGTGIDRVSYNALCSRFMTGLYGYTFIMSYQSFKEIISSETAHRTIKESGCNSLLHYLRRTNPSIKLYYMRQFLDLKDLVKSGDREKLSAYWEL